MLACQSVNTQLNAKAPEIGHFPVAKELSADSIKAVDLR